MADPASKEPFDIHDVIEKSSSRATLQDLARKGITRVKVLDEKMVKDLIRQAVEHILATKFAGGVISEEERQRIVEASKKELDQLIKEFQQSKTQQQLVEQDKVQLVKEVENLQRQVQLQRKGSDEAVHRSYEDGRKSTEQTVQDARERSIRLEEEIKRQTDALAAAQATVENLKQRIAQRETEARENLEKGMVAQRGMIEDFQAKLDAKLNALEGNISQRLTEESERQILARKLDELTARDTATASKLEKLFSKMADNLGRKIATIKLKAGVPDESDYRPGEMMIESLFKEELENNLRAIGVQEMKPEEKEKGKFGSALAKLKSLRPPSGPETPAPGGGA